MLRLIEDNRSEERKANADAIRQYADRVESGEIVDLVLVANNREDNCFERWGVFDDRWRLLGALEYAKAVALLGE